MQLICRLDVLHLVRQFYLMRFMRRRRSETDPWNRLSSRLLRWLAQSGENSTICVSEYMNFHGYSPVPYIRSLKSITSKPHAAGIELKFFTLN
jgi:hypothetical protein